MLFKAVYDSLDQVPPEYKEHFESKNGKWQLKEDAIEGVGDLFNAGIAANRDKALDQLKARNTEVTSLTAQLKDAESKANSAIPAGAVVLQGDDAKAWTKYQTLGTPKDVEKIVKENSTLNEKVRNIELTSSLESVAKAANLNHGVLSDWATHPSDGKGISFLTKKEKNDKNEDIEVAYVKVETPVDGQPNKLEVKEHKLIDFAKEKLPEWKFTALTAVEGQKPAQQRSGVTFPNLGKANKEGTKPTGGETTKAVEKFNAERAQTPNPFMPTKATTASQ